MTAQVRMWHYAVCLLAVALLACLSAPPSASAQGPDIPTLLTIKPMDPIPAGQGFVVTVRLTTQPGTGIPSMAIFLTLDGELPRQGQTDSAGAVTYQLHSLLPGTHRIVAVFNGALGYQPATASTTLFVTGASRTVLSLRPLGAMPLGKPIQITALLIDAVGAPIPDEGLELFVNGQHESTGLTDENGIASLRVDRALVVGTYDILVIYSGSRVNDPASATMKIRITSPEIELHTVPALEGVRFVANGKTFASDKDGIARLPVDQAGVYHVEILPYESKDPNVRIEFGRWEDDVFTSYHEVSVPTTGDPLEVGFNVNYKVSWTFVDLETHVVDPERVTSITLKGSDGATYTFPSKQSQWLPALHVLKRLTGLEESALQYSVIDVTLNGTNVVSAMQQRFYVRPNDIWQIQLLLFTAQFSSRDMIFGFPLGKSLRLEYPDRSVREIPLDSQGEATVVSLPRGLYKVNVEQVPGISPPAPLAMSRDQEVVFLVISYLDIAVGAVVGLLFGPGLLLIGRPQLRNAIGNRLPFQRQRPQVFAPVMDESNPVRDNQQWRRKAD